MENYNFTYQGMENSFVQSSERRISALSNSKVLDLVMGNGILEKSLTLTDMRVYYNCKKGLLHKIDKRTIVDLDEIVG